MRLDRASFELWRVNQSTYAVTVKNNPRLAHKLNRILRYYPFGAKFTQHDEPVFKFSETVREAVGTVLGIKQWPEVV